MKARLKVAAGKQAGKTIRLKEGTFLVGRSQECFLRARSDTVSRRHCEIVVDHATVSVRDLGSKNGTLVNGEPIDGQRELKPGDQLQVGPMQFELVFDAPVTAHPAEQPPADTVRAEIEPVEAEPVVETSFASPDAVETTAPAAASDDQGDAEDDVSQWLDDEVDETAPAGRAVKDDTDGTGMDETRQVNLDRIEPTIQKEQKPPASKLDKGKRKPGKLPRRPASETKDSGDAAGQALKGFARRS